MKEYWDLIGRQYRLGMCATLLILDAVLIVVFAYDVQHYYSKGYQLGTPDSAWMWRALKHAPSQALFMACLLVVVTPILVAIIRVLATWLKLPSIHWSPTLLTGTHLTLSILIVALLLWAVHMQLAAGRVVRAPYQPEQFGQAYTSYLAKIPKEAEAGMGAFARKQFLNPTFLFQLGLALFGVIGLHELVSRQKAFLDNYSAASRLTDFDATYLPIAAKAKKVSGLRVCAPLSPAIAHSIRVGLDAEQLQHFDYQGTAKRLRNRVGKTLLAGEFSEATVIRLLPDAMSCIFTAISNEPGGAPIALFPDNHAGVNSFLQNWFGSTRQVVSVSWQENSSLSPWGLQCREFVSALSATLSSPSGNIVAVVPLVSRTTGQVLDVRHLVDSLRGWSPGVSIILDASFFPLREGGIPGDLYGADYCCLNPSQLIGSSEPCGILITQKPLQTDPDWESQPAFAPVNVRTICAFAKSFNHAFKKTSYFNDPMERSKVLLKKFHDTVNPRKITTLAIPGLQQWSYYRGIQPSEGSCWSDNLLQGLAKMGISDPAGAIGKNSTLVLAFPPYLDYWQVNKLAIMLNNSVVTAD